MCAVLEKISAAIEIVFVGCTLLTEQSVLKSSPNEKKRCAHMRESGSSVRRITRSWRCSYGGISG
jgi:hypothetical protein